MRYRSMIVLALGAALLGGPGCNDGPASVLTPDGNDLETAMTEIALESDLMAEELLNLELDSMATTTAVEAHGSGSLTDERNFNRSRSCPAGGELRIQGRIVRTFDFDTHVLEVESSGTRTLDDCAFVREMLTITVDGSAQWEIFRRRVDGRPDGPQTTYYAGSWTAVRSDGEQRSCEFEVTIVRDPESGTRTIEGTLCGHRMRRVVSWHHAG